MNKLPTKENINETALFIKRLFFTLFGMSITGLGVYAAYAGMHQTNLLKEISFATSGMCAFLDGMYAVYKALMRK